MQAEIVFPYATGGLLIIAVAVILVIWRKLGINALLYLAIGLLFVAIESFLDGYEAGKVLAYGGWNKVPQSSLHALLVLDTVRGIFIVLWAAVEFLFAFLIGGQENKKLVYGIPAIVAIGGTLQTVYFNLYYTGAPDLETRIFVSSAIRVFVFLIPAALFAGGYILYNLYRPLKTKSSLLYGLGFVLHGLTLPTYSAAKEAGPAFLGLWYALGGVVPAFLAALGSYFLYLESKEEIVEEAE